ncbi:family 90 glycosyltransferase [Phakopsora pachyrhizi]|uniref:Family 90 glycosyltransferase n=1 Tax=Phakopsora pachyrhizi TaxID=170000 RepID=A0AAV0AHW1_PHAPC|nr:family 90 glycosyltransferase [Phakopsora pachyrhizi]CAH7666778.1 family 90 glycosyltransferase [Phakopsora pachyrhizi]
MYSSSIRLNQQHHHHNQFTRSNSTSSIRRQESKAFKIHPIALIPAFLLGILISSFYQLQHSKTSSLLDPLKNGLDWSFLSPSTQDPRQLLKEGRVRHHNDYIYFPKDYLNRTWSTNSKKRGKSKNQIYPLVELIQNATEQWKLKVSRQSKDLKGAVEEYQRRYKRLPPKGFREWFEWCMKNKVVLVDEYDRINELIEPFWALPPHILRSRSEEVGREESFSSFLIKNGQIKSVGKKKDEPRTKDQLKLLKQFSRFLPDLNFTISHHDGPSVFIDFKTYQKHLDYSRSGKILPLDEIDKVEDDASLWGFIGACSPDSPMRIHANGLFKDFNDQIEDLKGGYIGLDHPKTMNICNHPEWRGLHGFTSWAGPRPGVLKPIFSFAQSPGLVSDLLNVPLEQFEDVNKNQQDFKPFRNKTESKTLFWKGQTTGIWFDRNTNWRMSHRVRLHRLGKAFKSNYGDKLHRNVRLVRKIKKQQKKTKHLKIGNSFEEGDTGFIKMVEKRFSLKELSERFLTASFVGQLVQCTVDDGSCEAVKKEIDFDPFVDWNYQNNFKYVLDVDGNSWSGRFRRLLASNSLVFKSTIWPEWYRDHIQAWYHYVPVRIDYEDIFDLISFFTGSRTEDDQNYEGGDRSDQGYFEGLAERIAGQGTDWVKNHFRYEDLQAYMWRTCLEWARVSSDDRLNFNFKL